MFRVPRRLLCGPRARWRIMVPHRCGCRQRQRWRRVSAGRREAATVHTVRRRRRRRVIRRRQRGIRQDVGRYEMVVVGVSGQCPLVYLLKKKTDGSNIDCNCVLPVDSVETLTHRQFDRPQSIHTLWVPPILGRRRRWAVLRPRRRHDYILTRRTPGRDRLRRRRLAASPPVVLRKQGRYAVARVGSWTRLFDGLDDRGGCSVHRAGSGYGGGFRRLGFVPASLLAGVLRLALVALHLTEEPVNIC